MEEYLPLIIQLVSGAIGGNIAGSLLKNASFGRIGNSVLGILGGGIGGYLLGLLGIDTGGGMDIAGILGSIASGGVGGGVLMAIIGLIKKSFK
ncbi:hypothetical protein [Aquimarina spongiae]|uniref:Transglycosylase associated protein n=1 Tax=Aquimarina spongiae TaxID=570521 RepID=A0A1M6FG04_9FLAO|nr:hypothetical protein [Aquimarina spongiae]SHI96577.1 hypothetical protein SAMN04488508_104265 [Aquimarina spongiae]